MGAYLLRRILQAVPVLIFSSVVVFVLIRSIPGDTAVLVAGPDASNEQIAAVRQQLGLNQPLPVQYVIWARNLVTFNLGTSSFSHEPVTQLIAERAPATYILAASALLLSIPLGLALGIAAAVFHGRAIDYVITFLTSCFIAVPNFFFAILVILLFAVVLGWLPAGGTSSLGGNPLVQVKFLILPAVTLGLPSALGLSRLTKATTLEVLHEDFVRTARAKGLSGRVVLLRHVLKNALVPLSTTIGLEIGRLLGGTVIVEQIFGWPGLGSLTLTAITNRDYSVIQATILLLTLTFIAVNIVVDASYGFLDPRIRLSGGRAT